MAEPILMLEVSLGSSWPKDSPRMEASGFPEPRGPEIPKNRKNVFNKYFLHSKKITLSKFLTQWRKYVLPFTSSVQKKFYKEVLWQ